MRDKEKSDKGRVREKSVSLSEGWRKSKSCKKKGEREEKKGRLGGEINLFKSFRMSFGEKGGRRFDADIQMEREIEM